MINRQFPNPDTYYIEIQTTAMFYVMEEEKQITEIPPPQSSPQAQPILDDSNESVDLSMRPIRRRSSRQKADVDTHTTLPANVTILSPVSFHTHRPFVEVG